MAAGLIRLAPIVASYHDLSEEICQRLAFRIGDPWVIVIDMLDTFGLRCNLCRERITAKHPKCAGCAERFHPECAKQQSDCCDRCICETCKQKCVASEKEPCQFCHTTMCVERCLTQITPGWGYGYICQACRENIKCRGCQRSLVDRTSERDFCGLFCRRSDCSGYHRRTDLVCPKCIEALGFPCPTCPRYYTSAPPLYECDTCHTGGCAHCMSKTFRSCCCKCEKTKIEQRK